MIPAPGSTSRWWWSTTERPPISPGLQAHAPRQPCAVRNVDRAGARRSFRMRVPGGFVHVASWSLIAGFIVGLMISAMEPDPILVERQAFGWISSDVAIAEVAPR